MAKRNSKRRPWTSADLRELGHWDTYKFTIRPVGIANPCVFDKPLMLHILITVARYLAAHSPTERAALQTADIARRLMRGGELHQEEGASS